MEQDFREKQRKSYTLMRMTYDITMALLILSIGIILLFGDKFQIMFVQTIDIVIRYLFGGLCLLYGGFRMYRGIKRDY